MAMTGKQMHEVTLFAVGLNKMAAAAKTGDPCSLTADENAAMVSIIRSLTARVRDEAKPVEANPE